MANTKVGTVVCWRNSSPVLAVFRLMPQEGSRFPSYQAGQYIALRRNDCRLTKKLVREDRTVEYVTLYDEKGNIKRGPVTHSYSIASAPFETVEHGWLEFYVILEKDENGVLGRLTESMFRMDLERDNKLVYYDKIAGDFTLHKRADGMKSVVLVGTGTGIAPFVSTIKQLDHDASQGKTDGVRYTALHTNRTYEELDYYREFSEIERAARFDFVYIPSVSRPTPRDLEDPSMGKGRANNLLRYILGMPLKEEEDLRKAASDGRDNTKLKAVLDKTVRPFLPVQHPLKEIAARVDPATTVIITCGNPWSMEDIKHAAECNGIRFEKEDW